MTTLEQIKRIETEISNITKIISDSTFPTGDFINSLKVTLSNDSGTIFSSYWFGFNSKIERKIIDLCGITDVETKYNKTLNL